RQRQANPSTYPPLLEAEVIDLIGANSARPVGVTQQSAQTRPRFGSSRVPGATSQQRQLEKRPALSRGDPARLDRVLPSGQTPWRTYCRTRPPSSVITLLETGNVVPATMSTLPVCSKMEL